ncbi:hypothetical protein [Rosenbergiella epipactidis]|uniref:hypothetical protein n=1 Tax=Rosenbergiella epipactidis TaxID=1544694 RepID=UPI001F4DD4F5|nr:hypothetical protein [Rosenbergiella epipactidis]
MHPQDIQQQQIIRAIKTALTFDIAYQKVRPDISSFIAITSTLSLNNFKVWENIIRLHIALSLDNYSSKKCRFRTLPLGSLRWLDLCSGDGFKREKALKLLSGAAPNSFLFCLVTRRLNDWVPQVRIAAREALTRLIEATDPEHTVDMLWVSLPCWNSWTRMGELERKSLLAILDKPDIEEALKKRLMTSASGPVSTLFSQAGRTTVFDNVITDFAQHAIQPSLRAKAYRVYFESQFVFVTGKQWQWVDKAQGRRRQVPILVSREIQRVGSINENLRRAVLDSSPRVRRVAGEILIKELDNLGEQALKLATDLAADPCSSVSERGQFALRELQPSCDSPVEALPPTDNFPPSHAKR